MPENMPFEIFGMRNNRRSGFAPENPARKAEPMDYKTKELHT